MLSSSTDKLLTQVEALVDEVARATLGADGDALQAACDALRQAVLDVSQCLARLPEAQRKDAGLCARVARVRSQLGNQRSGVARQSARVELALHAIMPASRNATYGNARSPYGSGVTQTGAFKLLAA
jgi:hypothetical protein